MKKHGFTLAEVLITLVIIGVIAAMTVPTLMQNTNAQEFRSGLKKAVSALNQAISLEYALNGMTLGDYSTDTEVANVFKARMATVDNDNISVDSCSGQTWTTQDGMNYCISGFTGGSAEVQSQTCDSMNTKPCGDFGNLSVDVNGDRKPNKLTTNSARPMDVYQLTIYSQKVVPYSAAQGVMYDKDMAS